VGSRSRVYIDSDVHELVKRYATKKGITVVEAYRRIVYSVLDGEANEKVVVLDPETMSIVDEVARALGVDRSVAIRLMVYTVRILYDPRLSLALALRPIVELARIVGIDLRRVLSKH